MAIAARALRLLGYRATVRVLTHTQYDSMPVREDAAVQLGSASWWADYLALSNFLELWIACRGPFTEHHVCDPALDRRMARADALEATDPPRADALWTRIDHTAVDDALWVPLANSHAVELVSNAFATTGTTPSSASSPSRRGFADMAIERQAQSANRSASPPR